MQLKSISIRKQYYGENAGKYEGLINVGNETIDSNEIAAVIPHEVCTKIIVLCADELVNVAKVAAYDMTAELLEQVKQAQIEEQKDEIADAEEVSF